MAFRNPVLADFPSNRLIWLDRPDMASLVDWRQLVAFLNDLAGVEMFRYPTQADFPSNRLEWLDRPNLASLSEWTQFIDLLNTLDVGGGGSGGGYGVGPFGNVSWDVTVAPAGAYTVLARGVIIPNIATVGWGKEINDTFFTPLNDLIDRVTVLENA